VVNIASWGWVGVLKTRLDSTKLTARLQYDFVPFTDANKYSPRWESTQKLTLTHSPPRKVPITLVAPYQIDPVIKALGTVTQTRMEVKTYMYQTLSFMFSSSTKPAPSLLLAPLQVDTSIVQWQTSLCNNADRRYYIYHLSTSLQELLSHHQIGNN
jgi:hypothetical protein